MLVVIISSDFNKAHARSSKQLFANFRSEPLDYSKKCQNLERLSELARMFRWIARVNLMHEEGWPGRIFPDIVLTGFVKIYNNNAKRKIYFEESKFQAFLVSIFKVRELSGLLISKLLPVM